MTRTFNVLALASLLSGCALAPTAHAVLAPPEEELAGQLRAAIWYDLDSNALIGNGNELAFLWANAGRDRNNAPQLHIQDLRCSDGPMLPRCQFGLLRDGGIATYLGEAVSDRLACSVVFRRSSRSGRWSIPRLPPGPDGGHSRITIRCQPAT